jgi:23S rRNA (cytosine1962-C5)-methyltransferase
VEVVKKVVLDNITKTTQEFQRLFHGRGEFYEGFEDITIDSIDKVILICFYKNVSYQDELIEFLILQINTTNHTTLLAQYRYEKNTPFKTIIGEIPQDFYAIEDGIKFKLNTKNQNFGYFTDMKNGRAYIKEIAKDKNILNLFSYTCGFSLVAASGGAKMVTNVDMNKGVLSTGRENHHINNIPTSNINFMPYNILKSFSRIKKHAPYDIIIIDPPSFQKGSFVATNDYIKIIKKLDLLSQKNTIVLACLNAPELNSKFLIDLFDEHTTNFIYLHHLENHKEFPTLNSERSLKNLIFIKN